jgi:hypothetical protein
MRHAADGSTECSAAKWRRGAPHSIPDEALARPESAFFSERFIPNLR